VSARVFTVVIKDDGVRTALFTGRIAECRFWRHGYTHALMSVSGYSKDVGSDPHILRLPGTARVLEVAIIEKAGL
jgi:hypothetical protein